MISDPAGDSSGHADVLSLTGEIQDGNLVVTATFKAGTLDPKNLGFIVGCDTDQNLATGTQPPGNFPLGAEFSIYFSSASDPANALVASVLPRPAALVPVVFGNSRLSLAIPLAALGNDDGIMRFGLIAGVPFGQGGFIPYDTVPDSALGGPLGGPTSPGPSLSVRRDLNATVLRWDARATGHVLEAATSLSPGTEWKAVLDPVTLIAGVAEVRIQETVEARFYRLGP